MKSGSKAKLIKNIREALAQPLSQLTIKSCLADTRKLLELTGTDKKYATLKFYCDWILHTKMDRKFANDLLREADQACDNWIVRKIPMPADFETTIGYKIGLYGFEREMAECLAPYGIKLPWYGYRDQWTLFEQIYCDIVADSFLECSDKRHPLKQINGACVRVYKLSEHPEEKKDYQPGDYLPHGIEWLFTIDGDPVFAFRLTAPSENLIKKEAAAGLHLPSPPKTLVLPPL
jgi:hypothetical protein